MRSVLHSSVACAAHPGHWVASRSDADEDKVRCTFPPSYLRTRLPVEVSQVNRRARA
jgi:hypothetical protein